MSRSCWCGGQSLHDFGPNYLRCPVCDTLAGQAGLTDEETSVRDDEVDFYGKRYWLEHQRDELGLPDIYVRARQDLPERCVQWLETLLRYREPPARILEIGAGHGAYTALLRWAGYDATALDLSEWVAAFARATFEIPYLVGPVADQRLERQSFDVVVANDVLEHLPDPKGALQSWVELLKPGGVLVLQTPEYPAGQTYEELDKHGDLFLQHMGLPAKEHLYLFSRRSIELLLGGYGLIEVSFEEPVFPYDMLCVASAHPLRRTMGDLRKLVPDIPTAPLVLALIDAHDALQTSERGRAQRLVAIEQLDAALTESEADRKARLEVIEQLDAALKESQAERQAKESQAERQANVQQPPIGSPRISVVIPTYNGGDLLEECIVSVLEQGYANLELIVVDGGSTDLTLDVLRKYEARLAFWTSEPDQGQADALNKGFRRATGDLVSWLNADDLLYPGALAGVADAYLANPDAPFYFGNGYRADREGHEVAEFFPSGHMSFQRDALVFGLNYILQPATFIRRSALEQVGFLDDSLHYGFDTDLWIRLSLLGRPRPIRKHLAASREYEETKTSTGSFPRAEELRRIAERHAGVGATPGSIAYYLDTLRRLASSKPDVFPKEYLPAIDTFSTATAGLLARYGARLDGFPLADPAELARLEALERPKAGRTRVGIELRQATRGAAGGIVMVLTGTLEELFKRRPDIDFVVFCTVFNRELLELEAPNVELITLPLVGYFAELGRLARELQIDLLVRGYPTVEQLDYPREHQIFLIPDIQHVEHPEFFDATTLDHRRQAFKEPLEGAGAIMTISEYARRTIEEHAESAVNVFVASPSLPQDILAACSDDATDEERALLPAGDFFFFPANLWPHKNHDRLFEAFRRYRRRTGAEVELVLTGWPAGWDELRARHADLPIRHLGYVSAPLLRLVYERALALVFFSCYEGFGIPLLEAFEAGTPVVCSSTTSLPEVAGDAALMCDPTEVDAMSLLLERVAKDADLRRELVERGKQRLAAYTWGAAADRLMEAIERLVERVEPPELAELPLVSIVTPSYNQGRFIRRTIESVLAQTYPNIEYIVVDGASTDDTVDVLRSYGDRVRWISEPDSGQTEAINKGLKIVQGEIVGYLNSDDVLLPDAIETVVNYLRSHLECGLVYGDADYIDEQDRIIGTYPTADYSFERLLHDCCVCQPAAYWRRTVEESVGPFDESIRYAMDYDYWIRVHQSGFLIKHLPGTIAQSRTHPGTKTLSARRAIFREIFRVSRRHTRFISRSYVDGLWYHRVYERTYRPARLLRATPRLRRLLVYLHWLVLNRASFSRREWLAGGARLVRRLIVPRLRRMPRVYAFVLRSKVRLRQRRLLGAEPGSRTARIDAGAANGSAIVTGYWGDNWIGDRLEVILPPRELSRPLRIVGRPVSPMSLEVSANGTSLGRFDLAADKRESVAVQLPAGPRERISFSFSDHVVDPHGRRVSFLLEGTDVFREEDLVVPPS